jgi:hypothetical protein
LLQAATAEFLDKAYEDASPREIIRRGGGSSDTLYQHFGDKLFSGHSVFRDRARAPGKNLVMRGSHATSSAFAFPGWLKVTVSTAPAFSSNSG